MESLGCFCFNECESGGVVLQVALGANIQRPSFRLKGDEDDNEETYYEFGCVLLIAGVITMSINT